MQEALKGGDISTGHAKELKSRPVAEQVNLLNLIIEKDLPVRATREILAIGKMHGSVQAAFKEDDITTGHVKELSRLEKFEQEKTLQKIVSKGLSVKATIDLIEGEEETKARKKQKATNPHQAEIDKLEDELSDFFGIKVQLNVNEKSVGKLVIPLKKSKSLDYILEKIRE